MTTESAKEVRREYQKLARIRERERLQREKLRTALVKARQDGHSLASLGELAGGVSAQRVDQLIRAGNNGNS